MSKEGKRKVGQHGLFPSPRISFQNRNKCKHLNSYKTVYDDGNRVSTLNMKCSFNEALVRILLHGLYIPITSMYPNMIPKLKPGIFIIASCRTL